MKKAKNIMTLIGLLIMVAFIAVSCSQKHVEEDGQAELKTADTVNTAVIGDPKLEAERNEYRNSMEIRLKDNDDRIAELRAKSENADKNMREEYRKRIDEMKEKNDKLRDRVSNYRHEDDSKWEDFKREFSHDMDELGESLKNFTMDNKKNKK